MNYLFIILPAIAVATLVGLYILTRNAQEIEEDELPPVIKFEPRKINDFSKGRIDTNPVKEEPVVAPKKKKYYKKRTKRSE
jgi:hypothetical protein